MANDMVEDGVFMEYSGESEPITNQEEGLDAWLHEVGGETVSEIRVFRDMGGGNAKKAYLFAFEPQDLNWRSLNDKLRDEYGGGDFRVMAYGPGSSKNRMVLKFNRAFSIEPPRQNQSAVVHQESSNDLGSVLSVMRDMMEKSEERFLTALESVKPPQQNSSMKETMETMLAMKSLLGLENNSNKEQENSFDKVKEMMSLARELALEGGGERNMADVISSAIDKFAPIIQGAAETWTQSGAQKSPQGTAQIAHTQKPSPERNPQMMQQMKLIKDIQDMVEAAQRGSDAGLYVDLILDKYPEQQILSMINDPNLIGRMAMFVPAVKHYAPWFEEVKAGLCAAFESEQEEINNEVLQAGTGSASVSDNETPNIPPITDNEQT